MGTRAWALGVVAVVLAACGGGPPSPQPTEPTPNPGTPPTSPPTSTSPAAPASGPTPDPTAPSTPAAPTTPTSNPSCAGLVPVAPGAGVAYDLSFGSPVPSCMVPVTDGHGAWIGVGGSNKTFQYRFTSAAAPGDLVGDLSGRGAFDGEDVIAPQPDGYHVAERPAGDYPGSFRRYDARGDLLSDDGARDVFGVIGLPGGGSVVHRVPGWSPTPGGASVPHVVWMSAGGDRLADLSGAVVAAVSSTGDVLVSLGASLRWYDRSGNPATDAFPSPVDLASAARQTSGRVDHPLALADGSVVLFPGTDQAVRVAARATRGSPVPDWVKARAGETFANVRGGGANAFAAVKSAPGAACEIEIEILDAAGESCGTTRLRSASPCDRVGFGADRTVFATGGSLDASGGVVCSYRWWSGLLR